MGGKVGIVFGGEFYLEGAGEVRVSKMNFVDVNGVWRWGRGVSVGRR